MRQWFEIWRVVNVVAYEGKEFVRMMRENVYNIK